MCRSITIRHRCRHLSSDIEKCTEIIRLNRQAAKSWTRWISVPPPPTCRRIKTDIPKHGYHQVQDTVCPRCRKLNPRGEDIELILERHRVAKDIQQGKYVQAHPQNPAAAPTPSSRIARPALRSKFTEVDLATGHTVPIQTVPTELARSNALRIPRRTNTPQQVSGPARPTHFHRRMESKDVTDGRLRNDKYDEYYHSLAGSRMAFEHPSIAAGGGPKHSVHNMQLGPNETGREKPLPPTPPLLLQTPASGSSTSASQPPNHPPSSTSQKRGCHTAWKEPCAADPVAAQLSNSLSQKIRWPFFSESSPRTSHYNESRWELPPFYIRHPSIIRKAEGPVRGQVSSAQESVLDKATPLEGVSAITENGDEDEYTAPLDSYFVRTHTDKVASPYHDKRTIPGRTLPPPMSPTLALSAVADHVSQSASSQKSFHFLSSSSGEIPIYCTPRQRPAPTFLAPAGSPTRNVSDTQDVDFDSVEDMWNEATARGEARRQIAAWQDGLTSTSRTHSRETSTAQNPPARSVRPAPVHRGKPTPVQVRAPSSNRLGGWI